ncbi:MAG: ATP-binding protein [Actinobacteria bacterium]|nr:ATP-binding protein [Actinomycetota bacterium]MBU1944016.1 ATP-binding protein [Actinomycetota bacterium]MBU2688512.1 ATP-binding protein [Actinomycetota bacterium]
MEYREREIAGPVGRALEQMPVVVVTGVRQSGKSTLVQRDARFRDREYVTLDDFGARKTLEESPDAFLESYPAVTIDEAQRVPDLFLAIKRSVDRKRVPGRFLLTGSANPSLLRRVTESLAGRAVYFNLEPMSRREIGGKTGAPPFLLDFIEGASPPRKRKVDRISDQEILLGGLPPVSLREVGDPALWFAGFEQTYLERDLRDVAAVENIIGFRDLMKLSALRTAQILNIAEIGRDAKLEAKTAARYLGWLEATFITRRVPPYLRNRASRIKKAPKLYLCDSGLACYLTGCSELADDPLRGALFETYVRQNLDSILGTRIPAGRLFYWHTQAGKEVDFVVELGREYMAIEVKSGATWSRSDVRVLDQFLSVTPTCKAAVIAHNGNETIQIAEKIWAIPVGLLLS